MEFVNFVSHKPTHRPKIAKELTPLPPKEKLFLKFPSLLKFLKPLPTADTNRPNLNSTTTPKLTVDKDSTTSTEKKASLQHCIKAIAVWV